MPASTIEHLQHVLEHEEIERAGRFYFEKDRRKWIVAHALLRSIVGQYLKCDPRRLRFITNSYGKPSVVSPLAGKRLHFNLSHSGDLALYAFAYEREVGVDVEQMRAGIDYRELATHYFSVRECATLNALPANLQEEAFFLCWSRKEAYIKARGKGLSLPLDQFDVSLAPDEPPRLLGSREEPRAAELWSFMHSFQAEATRDPLPLKGLAGTSAAGNGKVKPGYNLKRWLCAWRAPPALKRGRMSLDAPNATRSTVTFIGSRKIETSASLALRC